MPSASQHTASPDAGVACVGEAVLMLAPSGLELLEHATCFAVSIRGSEANVAIGLKTLGVHASWIGKLPRNPLGYREASRRLTAANPLRLVSITIGEEGAGFDGRSYMAPSFEVRKVNRPGAGDAFVAGLSYGYMNSGLQAGPNYGTGDGRAENHGSPDPAARAKEGAERRVVELRAEPGS